MTCHVPSTATRSKVMSLKYNTRDKRKRLSMIKLSSRKLETKATIARLLQLASETNGTLITKVKHDAMQH